MEPTLKQTLQKPAMEAVSQILSQADESVTMSHSDTDPEGLITYTFRGVRVSFEGMDYRVDVTFKSPQDQQLPDGIQEDSIGITETIAQEG